MKKGVADQIANDQKEAEKAKVAELSLRLENLTKQLDLAKEIATLRQKVELDFSRLKWIGTTFGTLIAFLGFFGFKAWRDLTTTAESTLKANVAELSSQAFDLSRGFVLADARRYKEAIPFLTKCHQRSPFDQSVDSALIDALINDGDYETASSIVVELRSNDKEFHALANPLLFNNIGRVLLFSAIDHPEVTDDAEKMFSKALMNSAPGAYSTKYPFFNLFRLWILKGDLQKASNYLSNAYQIDKGYANESYTEDAWYRRCKDKQPDATIRARGVILTLPRTSK
jgi:tetratricopeptide (TPR) repeat protein